MSQVYFYMPGTTAYKSNDISGVIIPLRIRSISTAAPAKPCVARLCGGIFANLRDLGGIRRPFMTYDHKHEALS